MTTRGRRGRTLYRVDNVAVLGDAMTDYVLATGTTRASAAGAPEHMAAWLEAHGYRIVRTPGIGPVDIGDPDLVDRIAALIDWRSICEGGADRRSILRQVLAAVAIVGADVSRGA